MMGSISELLLANLPLWLVAGALLLGAFRFTGEAFCRYLLLLPVGIGGFWGFAAHAFTPDYTASLIGWPASPFQYEVAAANLGLGILGIVGFWKCWDFALAATLMVASFLSGAALIHLIEMLFEGNFHPGNTGSILYSDLLIPLLLATSLSYWKIENRQKGL